MKRRHARTAWVKPIRDAGLALKTRALSLLARVRKTRSGGADPAPKKRRSMDNSPFVARMLSAANWIQVHFQPFARRVNWDATRKGSLIFALAFVAASAVSTFAVGLVIRSASPKKRTSMAADFNVGAPDSTRARTQDDSGASTGELTRQILTRNLFNAEGQLAPEQTAGSEASKQTQGLDFEAVPCSTEKMPVEVLGTIDTGNPFASFVTVKDQKVSYADTYKAGSLIIDYEDYEVYKVTRDVVEFRKGDQKLCVTLNKPRNQGPAATGQGTETSRPEVSPENIVTLEFSAEELSQGIGPGYANILNSAKLIPVPVGESGGVAGFKLIAIKPESLFNKLRLQNQDIVTEVNGVSLKDASEGFKLYQALQEEREINIRVMRGDVPMTFLIRVK